MISGADQRRRFRRAPVSAGAMELEVWGAGPTPARLPVLDFSPDGVAVATSAALDWAPGAAVALRLPAGRIACRAQPVPRSAGDEPGIVGVRLELEGNHRHALADAYHRLRFPTISRRGEVPAAVVYDLFDRSGYIALKKDVAPSEEWLAARWPDTLTREAIYTAGDGTVLGHIGVTRAYRRTWLGHEIATRRDHPEAMACRRSLYHHFATWPRLLDGEEAMLVGYYNRARPWHRAMFEGFAEGADPARECLVLPLDRFLLSTAEGSVQAGVTVAAMRASEAGPVAALIAAQWPALAVAAFDLDAARVQSACLHPEYAAAGLSRGRSVLVLRRGDQLLGAATCETASGHLSLFNVLNCAQLFFAAAAPVEARHELVAAVRTFFAARGVPSPLVVATPGHLPEAPGLRLLETMGTIVWTARGLRRYEDYIDRALADYPLGAKEPVLAGSSPPPRNERRN